MKLCPCAQIMGKSSSGDRIVGNLMMLIWLWRIVSRSIFIVNVELI